MTAFHPYRKPAKTDAPNNSSKYQQEFSF